MRDSTPDTGPADLPAPPLPAPGEPWALLLDIDGTLVGFEARPQDVRMTTQLIVLLDRIRTGLGGALAILSGRALADVDRLCAPLTFTAGALHGAELRTPSGTVQVRRPDEAATRVVERACTEALRDWNGVQLETKSAMTFALHYRSAPAFEPAVRRFAEAIAASSAGQYVVQFGACVAELKPAGPSKGTALSALASGPPFAGRRPVVVGDDLTDESAFEQAQVRGGFGVVVGSRRPTAARFALAGHESTLEWLRALDRHLGEGRARA
jgi:trehalose 6-phosphate phosphatase